MGISIIYISIRQSIFKALAWNRIKQLHVFDEHTYVLSYDLIFADMAIHSSQNVRIAALWGKNCIREDVNVLG